MMDLIQLLLPQQTGVNTDLSNEMQDSEELPEIQQNQVLFIAMLRSFLNNQDVVAQTSAALPSIMVREVSEEILESTEVELLENIEQEFSLPAQDRIPLAWIDAESFEPPSVMLVAEMEANFPAKKIPQKNSDDSEEKTQQAIITALVLPLESEQLDKIITEMIPMAKEALGQITIREQDLSAQLSSVESDLSINYAEPTLNPPDESLKKIESLKNTKEINEASMPIANTFIEKKQALPLVKLAEHSLNLSENIDSPDWGEHFNSQIIWLGQQKIKTAIIKLTPPELGPLEVKVDLVKDETKINIRTQAPEVGELIEQAIPRLRDLMSLQGIQLLQVNVESNSNQRHSQSPNNPQLQQEQSTENDPQLVEKKLNIKLSQRLIDYFA